MPTDDPHAVLADPTRRAILRALREAPGPLEVRALAVRLGLHANSVREQLRRLERGGFVRVSRASPAGRGRPGLRYEAAPEPEEPYRALAGALADQVATLPGAEAIARAAGERWGQAAARPVTATRHDGAARSHGLPSSDDTQALDAVVGLLAEAGFAPEPAAPGVDALRLRACPFLPFDRRHVPVVCGVHLGFVRGALRELGSSLDAVAIEPFVEPDLCVARLGRIPSA